MNTLGWLLATVGLAFAQDSTTLSERIDLYHPVSGEYLGAEQTWYGPDGRRLRLETTDADGTRTLLFFLLHDAEGRESEGIYFESGPEPWRETFTYADDGRLKVTSYVVEPGVIGERTESVLDEDGREVFKRYYRADGSQYGEEDVLWNSDGLARGWDFRYLERPDSASFRYEYTEIDPNRGWVRRTRSRNGVPERMEVRSLVRIVGDMSFLTPARIGFGSVSTSASETSPSVTRDGRTMVFARYDDDWDVKIPYLATLGDAGWVVEPLSIGPVYNVAIAPDGNTILYASADGSRSLHRIVREGTEWSAPENLTAGYGFQGTYPCLTEDGDLVFFDAEGRDGAGVYLAKKRGNGFATPVAHFVPAAGEPFDPFVSKRGDPMFVTMCFDTTCASGARNGVWEIGETRRKLPSLPYGWGAQPVPALGLFVFTDGADILAVPLSAVMPAR